MGKKNKALLITTPLFSPFAPSSPAIGPRASGRLRHVSNTIIPNGHMLCCPGRANPRSRSWRKRLQADRHSNR